MNSILSFLLAGALFVKNIVWLFQSFITIQYPHGSFTQKIKPRILVFIFKVLGFKRKCNCTLLIQ